MSEAASTTERIVAAAERRMRESGFHGFSFREIAADVGIKSASVHHHFPTKQDLAAAVTRAYTDRFMAALGDPADPARAPSNLVALYVDVCRRILVDDRRMCLGCLLASEGAGLPAGVHAEAQRFFERTLGWLETVLRRRTSDTSAHDPRAEALRIVATLDGAVLVAYSLGDVAAFDSVAAGLIDQSPGRLPM
jgi:TetR/AcrR family transcriptional repressor of nem operon